MFLGLKHLRGYLDIVLDIWITKRTNVADWDAFFFSDNARVYMGNMT